MNSRLSRKFSALLQNPERHPAVGKQARTQFAGRSRAFAMPTSNGWRQNVKVDLEPLDEYWWIAPMARPRRKPPNCFAGVAFGQHYLSASPDGNNINDNCGALHPEALGKAIAEKKGQFDLGVTFDGDADRVLFSDANGRVVNGDAVLLLAARDMQSRGVLSGSTIVATTMSNMGLEIALSKAGVRMLRANVGDKYVLEEMLKSGAILGGEQSGHIIFRDGEATTGDGLLTALRVMEIMARSGTPLAELIGDLKVFPQIIQNIRVREKVPLAQVPEIQSAIETAERELNGNGRVVVRYSGTEALARVMVEAESEEKMRALAGSIAGAIKNALGV